MRVLINRYALTVKPMSTTTTKTLLILFSFVIIACAFLSNKQAHECIERAAKADHTCYQYLDACFHSQKCISDFEKGSECEFPKNDYIFNGHCFKKWAQQARESRYLIFCIIKECGLYTNFVADPKKLYECEEKLLMDTPLQCGEECEQDLKTVRDCILKEDLDQCYSLDRFNNTEAKALIGQIRNNCFVDRDNNKQAPKEPQQEKTAQETVQIVDNIETSTKVDSEL